MRRERDEGLYIRGPQPWGFMEGVLTHMLLKLTALICSDKDKAFCIKKKKVLSHRITII